LNTPDKIGSEYLIKEIEDGLKKFHSQISSYQIINVSINICFLRFQTQNYRQLIDALSNTFALIGREEKMYQLLSDLKFMELMAHFSLKNHDLLDYQLRNTERWLKEHQLNQPFTDILLKSFPALRAEPQYSKIKNQLITIACPNNLQSLKTLVLDWMEVNPPVKSTSAREGRENANLPASHTQY
jgi:hypothetical protein